MTDALSAMLPSPEQTSFLRACLLEGDAVTGAWRDWLRSVEDPLHFLRETGRELRSHLPLLHRNLTEHGAVMPSDLKPYLQAAPVREQLRFEAYEQCFLESVEILSAAGIDFTVLKGAALARTMFDPPFLRHCHDLDLWVTEEERPDAQAALVSHGFRNGSDRNGTTRLEHPRGLPVLLHTRLLATPLYRMSDEEMRCRRRMAHTASGSWKVLALPDMLLHVCAHASTSRRRPHANWVVDAHRVSAQLTALDWETFEDVACRAGLALPVAVLLRYLEDELAAPVPVTVIESLSAAAGRIEPVHLLAAIDGAWLGRPGGLRSMLSKSSWRSRWTVARSLLLPPPRYLRSTRGPMGTAGLAGEYLVRPWRFVARRMRQRRESAATGRVVINRQAERQRHQPP